MDYITREVLSTHWLTLTIVLAITTLTVAKVVRPQRFYLFLTLIGSNKYVTKGKKQQRITRPFTILLTIFQTLSISLFLYLSSAEIFQYQEPSSLLLLQIILLYPLFMISKMLIEKIIGVIFSIEPMMNHFLYCKLSYRNYLGILLLPVTIILIYTIPTTRTLYLTVLAIAILAHILMLTASYRLYQKIILENLFYFILYLCALEIAPYYILYKLFEIY